MSFPTSPTNGQEYTAANGTRYRYASATDSWIKLASTDGIPSVKKEYSTTDFTSGDVGKAVRFDITLNKWVLAQANSAENAEVGGIISAASTSAITVTTSGYISGLTGLTAGEVYRLSETVAGGLTATDTPIGSYEVACMIAISATEGIVRVKLGFLVGADAPDWKDGKNVIINGDMRIVQRGTSFADPSNGTYTLDRWIFTTTTGVPAVTITQDSDAPTEQFNTSLKVDVTTADGTVDAADYMIISQYIEGYNFRKFKGQTATVSFWVKSNKIGTMCVSFRSYGSPFRSYVSEITIDSADTWEYKTVTLTFNYDGSGGISYTNGGSMILSIMLMGGTNVQTSNLDQWENGSNYLGSPSQDNWMDNTANYINLTGVQLELGEEATEFEFLDYSNQLSRCQRYFERIAPSTQWGPLGAGLWQSTILATGTFSYVEKRITPTVTFAGDWRVRQQAANVVSTNESVTIAGTSHAQWSSTVASGGVAGEGAYLMGWNTASDYVDLSAEL